MHVTSDPAWTMITIVRMLTSLGWLLDRTWQMQANCNTLHRKQHAWNLQGDFPSIPMEAGLHNMVLTEMSQINEA
jgi:hypothetical protein